MKINCKITACAFHNRVKDTCTLSEITIKPIDIDGLTLGYGCSEGTEFYFAEGVKT